MVTFDPPSWEKAGYQMLGAADAFYRGAHGVITAKTVSGNSGSGIDGAVMQGDSQCNVPWHRLIAAAQESLSSTGSKAQGTGTNYGATEETAAAQRYW